VLVLLSTVEKDEFGEVVRLGFILTEKPFMFLLSVKIIRVFSCQVIRNGNQITIQTNRVKIH
jgi:hypothetical protein